MKHLIVLTFFVVFGRTINGRDDGELSHGDKCIMNCTNDAYRLPEYARFEMRLVGTAPCRCHFNASTFVENLIDQDTVDNLCNVINKTNICLEQCGESQVYEESVKPLVISFNYMCNQSSFREATPCFTNVFQDMQQTCNEEKCIWNDELYNYKKDLFESISNINLVCNHTSCLKHCRHERLVEQCGQNQTNILHEIIRHFFNAWDKIMIYRLPDTCNPLRKENL